MDGQPVLDTLINPEQPIPPATTAVHSITDETVRSAPTFADAWPSICAVLNGVENLIVYNAGYDMAIIRRLAKELAHSDSTMPICPSRSADDAMHIAHAFMGGSGKYPRLNEACAAVGIQQDASSRQRAMGDCRATRQLLIELASK